MFGLSNEYPNPYVYEKNLERTYAGYTAYSL